LPKRGIIKSPFNKGGLRGIWGAFSGENDIIKNLEKGGGGNVSEIGRKDLF
jgi:hypothetical protein